MIFIDTSALIDSLTGKRRSGTRLIALLRAGERIVMSSLVLYEWLRGPRTAQELRQQEEIFPGEQAVAFGAAEAARAAELYKRVARGRAREIDLAIAATALLREAPLWTLNPQDFRDVPALELV